MSNGVHEQYCHADENDGDGYADQYQDRDGEVSTKACKAVLRSFSVGREAEAAAALGFGFGFWFLVGLGGGMWI